MPIEISTYENALASIEKPAPGLTERIKERKREGWAKPDDNSAQLRREFLIQERAAANNQSKSKVEAQAALQASLSSGVWAWTPDMITGARTETVRPADNTLLWGLTTPPISADLLNQQIPRTDSRLSAGENEDPRKLKLFQDFITNLNSNVPKIYSNAELSWVQKAIAEMTKNPGHHAQFNAAINQLFGKNIQIDPGSIQDTWFAFLSFKWNDGTESKEFSLWMNSSNILVEKKMFAPDEYKTVGKYHLTEHPLWSESPEKYTGRLWTLLATQASGGKDFYADSLNRIEFLKIALGSVGVVVDLNGPLSAQETSLQSKLTPDAVAKMREIPEIMACLKWPNDIYTYSYSRNKQGATNDYLLAVKLGQILQPNRSAKVS